MIWQPSWFAFKSSFWSASARPWYSSAQIVGWWVHSHLRLSCSAAAQQSTTNCWRSLPPQRIVVASLTSTPPTSVTCSNKQKAQRPRNVSWWCNFSFELQVLKKVNHLVNHNQNEKRKSFLPPPWASSSSPSSSCPSEQFSCMPGPHPGSPWGNRSKKHIHQRGIVEIGLPDVLIFWPILVIVKT